MAKWCLKSGVVARRVSKSREEAGCGLKSGVMARWGFKRRVVAKWGVKSGEVARWVSKSGVVARQITMPLSRAVLRGCTFRACVGTSESKSRCGCTRTVLLARGFVDGQA